MANTPNDYRDPKVSTTTERAGSNRNWLWIALAVLAGLILLGWLLGLFSGDDEVDAVVTEEPAAVGTTTTDDVDAVVVPAD